MITKKELLEKIGSGKREEIINAMLSYKPEFFKNNKKPDIIKTAEDIFFTP